MELIIKNARFTAYVEWILDGNVVENPDGSFATKDTGYRNRIQTAIALYEYFINNFCF